MQWSLMQQQAFDGTHAIARGGLSSYSDASCKFDLTIFVERLFERILCSPLFAICPTRVS
ncbi:MAG: hypothetical protein RJB11_1795 [Planctomycetota bacterium]|jgi:hypothetical protein